MDNYFQTNIIRKDMCKKNIIHVTGFYGHKYEEGELHICIDGKSADITRETVSGHVIAAKYSRFSDDVDTEENIEVKFDDEMNFSKFSIEFLIDDDVQTVLSYTKNELEEAVNRVNYNIDKIIKEKGEYIVDGWCAYLERLDISVYDKNGKEIPCEIEMYDRRDVSALYYELGDRDTKYGFKIKFKSSTKNVVIKMLADDIRAEKSINLTHSSEKKKSMVNKAISYYKDHGMKAFAKRCVKKLTGQSDVPGVPDYNQWAQKQDINERMRKRQEQTVFENNVKFSIIVPLYNTPVNYLNELIDSVMKQTYKNFELCFADGSSNNRLVGIFEKLMAQDSRIKYKKLDDNKGISENTNEALKLATGDYIVLADHDDLLTPDALYEFVKAANMEEPADVIYSDEDKISMDGKKRFQPHFKPDYNVDLLCSVNYICHLFAVKSHIVNKIGGFRKEFDGAQDYDFIFRCVENAKNIYHVPRVLYHWRSHINSTAENPESKLYAFEAGKRAISEHFKRIGIDAEVEDGPAYGFYHSKILVKGNPKVSIIIPNKDHIDDLDKCVKSIFAKTDYENYEIVIVENNSTEDETFKYYKNLEADSDKVKVVYWEHEFNYSKINNFAIPYATGDYLLFLNNDIEVINAGWMSEMLGYCQREDVGIVGARLYYPDDTIQHAGVIIGYGGIAGHAFIGQARNDYGYFARAMCTQDYSAVTAACMLTRRDVFEAVGGFDEKLCVAFNDIDYCMKVRKYGKLVVYNAYAELYHYESKSRGLEDTPEKIKRFNGEIEIFRGKWNEILESGDPFYNPNLSLNRSDFAIKSN